MSAFYAELSSEGLLHIEGPDTLKFLQGQTTCDTRTLSASQSLPGAYCNPQGRMVCDFLLTQLAGEHVVLRMRRSIMASAAATLGKYILFSKAKLDAAREDWSVFACWGEDAESLLSSIVGEIPVGAYAAAMTEGCAVVRMAEALPYFEVYLGLAQQAEFLQRIAEAMQAADEALWQAWQIGQGIARVEAETVGEFIPQLFNYDLTGHVSFTKGCYTGQEIVARLHYRGKPKQRTHLLELDGDMALAAGTKLFTPGQDNSTGTLLNSAAVAGHTLCLAAVNAQGVSGGLQLEGGNPLVMKELPYALPS
ncbi:YgfZ/GcvT domain-containing protein [Haliea sp. E17]|uniref:CAF17-like 4Fe-4S cluster assembly/insertion protein YgfZ n=1 Tax=Haliea sp. E17 TaxID=3401576 RepID=UPI003AAC3501